MKPSVLALLFALLGLAPAQAQQVGMPPPAGTEAVLCAYNTSPPSLTTGNVGFLQCDNLGKLLTSQAGASATFGAAFPATGTPPGFTISGLFQPWNGLTAGGVNYGLVGVVDNTGSQLNGYTAGTAGVASTQVLTIQGIASGTVVPVSGTVTTNSASAATGGATYAHIAAGQATTVVKGSAGTLYSICLNSAATATNTTNVYDNATTSGTVIATVAATTATVPTCLQYGPYGIAVANGIVIITATANGGDMTVAFK